MKLTNLAILIAVFLIGSTVIWMIADRNQGIWRMQVLKPIPATPLAEPQATPVATVSATQAPPTPLAGPHLTPASTFSAAPLGSSVPDAMPKGPYQGLNDPRWPIYWKKREQDRAFEWKTPIEFYGKVLDQDGNPVAGATAGIVWTDLSSKGSSGGHRVSVQILTLLGLIIPRAAHVYYAKS